MTDEHLTKKERKALRKQEQEANRQAQLEARRVAKVKRYTIITISAIVIIAFLGWLIQNAPEKQTFAGLEYAQDATPNVINPVSENDNVKGSGQPLVTIVEYSDFQCPACAAAYPFIKDVVENNPGIQLVYRHFPLSFHRNAFLAAQFVEAAGAQGNFFDMHDLVFENQDNWANLSRESAIEAFTSYATSIGLDAERLTIDALSTSTIEKINAHYSDGLDAGVEWTPTFYINGTRVEDNALLQSEIGQALSEVTQEPPSTINIEELEQAIGATEN